MKTASAHLPRVVGYATVAAMLPYLAIKTAWILGSEIGVAEPGLMRTTPFVVGNLLTAGMELAGAGLALALVHRWGQRMPTWLLLFPMWVASGLLAPVMLAAPLGFLAESLTGMGATGGLDAGDGPVSGLQGWVYAVVYTGFTLQGAGLAVAFALHLRTRWSRILTAYLDPAASVDATRSTDPAGSVRAVGSVTPAATHGVQVMATVAVGGLTALVVATRLYWAAGGGAGLPSTSNTGRSLPELALDGSSAALALVGLLGLVALVSRRPPTLRAWMPLAAVWVGAGSMVCSGAYQLILLLAPGTPFETSGGGGFGLLLVVQTLAGLLAATTGAFHLAEAHPSMEALASEELAPPRMRRLRASGRGWT